MMTLLDYDLFLTNLSCETFQLIMNIEIEILTHSCPYESSNELNARESHWARNWYKRLGQNPLSAMIQKYVKKPADAWIIPICPYANEINLYQRYS